MMKFKILLITLFFSFTAIAKPLLSAEEDRVAEIYANYVSHQLFVELCSEHNAAKNYQIEFDKWFEKNHRDITSGRLILTRHYSSQDLKIDDVFKWKTDAEAAYFKEATVDEKITTCKRLFNLLEVSAVS